MCYFCMCSENDKDNCNSKTLTIRKDELSTFEIFSQEADQRYQLQNNIVEPISQMFSEPE